MRLGIRIIRFSDFDILKSPESVQATIYRELTKSVSASPQRKGENLAPLVQPHLPTDVPSPGTPGEG
jgi:hypothetical protein